MKHFKKLYTRENYKTKEEWLSNRGIGGTGASAIAGCNERQTKLDVYKSIKFPKLKTIDKTNESMEYGVLLEPIIRQVFAIDFKDKYNVVSPNGFEMYRRVDKTYMTATIDGSLVDKKTKDKYILEIKTHDIRSKADEMCNWTNSIPQKYFIQVCHYLAVLNDYKGGVLVAKLRFFGGSNELIRTETRYYTIYRKDVQKSIDNLEKMETDFWENNVVKNIPPTLCFNF